MTKLVCAFGSLTSYSFWAFDVLFHVMFESLGSCHRIHCHTVADLRTGWEGRGGRAVLTTSDRPDPALLAVLLAAEGPRLVFLDRFEDAVAATIGEHGLPPRGGIEFVSRNFSALAPLLSAPETLVLGSEWLERKTVDFVREIAVGIGLADDALIARVADVQTAGNADERAFDSLKRQKPNAVRPGDGMAGQPADVRSLTGLVAEAYRPIEKRLRLGKLDWPRVLFHANGEQGPGARVIDLVGGARYLLWGPYLHLPLGQWSAWVEFEILGGNTGYFVESDVCQGARVLTAQSGTWPSVGVYRYRLDFSVDALDEPIQIRVKLAKGAIEGRFSLRGVTVEQMS